MTDMSTNEECMRKHAQQWAEKKLIVLGETEEYDRELSELTGSEFQGDFEKIKKLDNYQQAKIIEMMFQENEKRKAINSLLGIEEYYGLLLAGPAGCGKLSTAKHLVGNLRQRGYESLFVLTGIGFGNYSLDKAVERIKAILDFATEDRPLILILEQLSENKYAEELYDILQDFVMEQETEIFFPILIERDACVFPSAVRRNFPLIMFELPSFEERKNYIRLHQNVEVYFDKESGSEEDGESDILSYKIVFDGITLDEMASDTEGFSYAQLKYLMEYVKLYMADIIVRDRENNQNVCERIQEEGRYSVKGHMVRKAIHMLNYAGERSALTVTSNLSEFYQKMPRRFQQPQSDLKDMDRKDIKLSLSEEEQKVKIAAEGGKKDYTILAERYKKTVHKMDEFGVVDERLANSSDVYDTED